MASQCDAGLLLDLSHFAITSLNTRVDAMKEIERLPLERVVEIHVSGYNEQSGVVWDDHAAPAPPLVFDLLERVAARARPRALTLEYNWLTFPTALLVSHIERSRTIPGARMNARQVHAVLAAGVENPALISAWRTEPTRLLRLGVEPGTLDLDALWKFAGLTIKVRHNGVRQQLPGTFRLMAVAGTGDRACSPTMRPSACRPGNGMRRRLRSGHATLCSSLRQWLNPSVQDPCRFWGTSLRHEQALLLLNATPHLGLSGSRDGGAPGVEP